MLSGAGGGLLTGPTPGSALTPVALYCRFTVTFDWSFAVVPPQPL